MDITLVLSRYKGQFKCATGSAFELPYNNIEHQKINSYQHFRK